MLYIQKYTQKYIQKHFQTEEVFFEVLTEVLLLDQRCNSLSLQVQKLKVLEDCLNCCCVAMLGSKGEIYALVACKCMTACQ